MLITIGLPLSQFFLVCRGQCSAPAAAASHAILLLTKHLNGSVQVFGADKAYMHIAIVTGSSALLVGLLVSESQVLAAAFIKA